MVKKKVAWKDKKTYTIIAPKIFNFQEVGTTFGNDSKSLLGRTVELSLSRLVGDKSKQPINVSFEIEKVEENKAKTKVRGISLDPRYVRSKVKKGTDKVECVTNLNLPPSKLWMKVIVITHQATQTSKIKIISAKVSKILKRHEKSNLDDFFQSVLFGKLGTGIYREVKKIVPIKRVEIEKVKVL